MTAFEIEGVKWALAGMGAIAGSLAMFQLSRLTKADAELANALNNLRAELPAVYATKADVTQVRSELMEHARQQTAETRATRQEISDLRKDTNEQLSALREETAAMRAELAGLRADIKAMIFESKAPR